MENQARSNSLSARLDEIDRYTKETYPSALNRLLDEGSRPKGYNPLESIKTALQIADDNSKAYQRARDDYEYSDKAGYDLLKELADLSKNSGMSEIEQLLLKKDVEEGRIRRNPETGEIEYVDEIPAEGQKALTLIEELLGRDTARVQGFFGGVVPTPLSVFGEGVTTKEKQEQLKALLALGARKLIKGTGPISDTEQKLLQDSVASLSPNMSDADFRKELNKIAEIIKGNYRATSDKNTSGGNKKGADPLGLGI